VRLDVRPGFETNALILPDGLLVARVYGWSREPHDRIEPSTVRLAGASPTRVVADDYDGDGREDLQLYFQTATMRLSKDATSVALTARTVAGTPIGGTDAILVVTTDVALRDR
jgi:hypothetical protein